MHALGAEDDDAPKKGGFLSRITNLVKKKEEAPPAEKEKPKPEAKGETKSKATSASSKSKSKDSDEPPAKPKSSTASTSSKKKSGTSSTAKSTSKKSTSAEVAKKSSASDDKKPAEKKTTDDKPKADESKTASTDKKDADSKAMATSDKGSTTKPADDKAKETKSNATAEVAADKGSAPKTTETNTSVDPPGRPMGGFAPGDERAIDVTSSTRSSGVSTSGSAKLTEPPASAGVSSQLPPVGKNGGWEILKHEGRDYISAASVQRFYNFGTYKVEGKHVWLRTTNLILKAEIGSMEMLINNVKFILSYPVTEVGGKVGFSRLDLCKLIDPVLRPSYIADADPFDTVVLDAGHGGHDSGAKGVYGYEKDFTLKMVQATKASLERRGFKVILTRSTDEFISRTGRVAIANRTPNSIFISIHFNSSDGSSATGIETFALTPQGGSASLERGGGYNGNGLTGNRQDSENIALATAVHAKVVSTYKLIDRGIKRAQWTVLTGCTRPGILFEGGFVTNANECRFIASDAYRRSLAETIGDAVVNYRRALQPASNMVKRRQ